MYSIPGQKKLNMPEDVPYSLYTSDHALIDDDIFLTDPSIQKDILIICTGDFTSEELGVEYLGTYLF